MYPDLDEEDYGTLATVSDAISEWARNVGFLDRYKDSQYLLTDYDSWVVNPHYHGPEQPHPEDDRYEESEQDAADREEMEAYHDELNRAESERWEDGFRDEPEDDLPW